MLFDSVAICGRDDVLHHNHLICWRQFPRRLSVVIVDTSSETQILVGSVSSYTMTYISEGYSEERYPNHGSNTTWLTIIRKAATSIGDLFKAPGTPVVEYAEALSVSVYRHPPRIVNSQPVLTFGPTPTHFLCPEREGPSRQCGISSLGHPSPIRDFASLGRETRTVLSPRE